MDLRALANQTRVIVDDIIERSAIKKDKFLSLDCHLVKWLEV